jgi:hypothetical protein
MSSLFSSYDPCSGKKKVRIVDGSLSHLICHCLLSSMYLVLHLIYIPFCILPENQIVESFFLGLCNDLGKALTISGLSHQND